MGTTYVFRNILCADLNTTKYVLSSMQKLYVTGHGKRAHFAHYFKIDLLVFNGSVDLKQICGIFFVLEVTRCGVLAISVQSLLAYSFKTKSRKRLIEVSCLAFFSSP